METGDSQVTYANIMRRFISGLWPIALVALLVLAGEGVLRAYPVRLIKGVVDSSVQGRFDVAGRLALILLAVRCGSALLTLCAETLQTYLQRSLSLNVQQYVFTRVLNQPPSFFRTHPIGALTSTIRDDGNAMAMAFVAPLSWLGGSVITFVSTLLFLMSLDMELSLIYLPVALCMGITGRVVSTCSRRVWAAYREVEAEASSLLHEVFLGIKDVQVFQSYAVEQASFGASAQHVKRVGVRSSLLGSLLTMSNNIIFGVGAALILYLGGRKVVMGAMTVGDLTAFIAYAGVLTGPINSLTRNYDGIQKGMVSARRLLNLVGGVHEHQNAPAPNFDTQGDIQFRNVSFSYGDKPVLQGVTFHIHPGEKVIIVGESGCGKSTLIDLLLRFEQPSAGDILIDNTECSVLPISTIRNNVSVALQSPHLFSRSLHENITMGAQANPILLTKVVEAAKAHDFIVSLPQGAYTKLNTDSSGLSGGQKQRIALARAIYKQAPIYIFDEPTAALDRITADGVITNLFALLADKTVMVITHDVQLCPFADRVVFLESGRVRNAGTHQELLARDACYQTMFRQSSSGPVDGQETEFGSA